MTEAKRLTRRDWHCCDRASGCPAGGVTPGYSTIVAEAAAHPRPDKSAGAPVPLTVRPIFDQYPLYLHADYVPDHRGLLDSNR